MVGLLTQIKAFGLTLILGIITGAIFQYYQLTVRNVRPGKYSLYLLDFILWIFLILMVFVSLLIINQGEMRAYVFIALLAGVFLYYRYLWQRLIKPLSYLARATAAGFETVISLLHRPFIAVKNFIQARKPKNPPPDPVE